MDMLHARPMLVADHFMASLGKTDAADMGEVCETCYAHCAGKTELWRHARDVHGADQHMSCPEPGCGRRFFAAAMCAGHREHHRRAATDDSQRDDDDHDVDGRPFTCELCGRLSSSRSAYYKHVNAAHPEARVAMCGVCHSYKGDVLSLVAHVRRRHAVDTSSRKSVRCTVCGKQYGNLSNMFAHRRVHGSIAGDVIIVPVQ